MELKLRVSPGDTLPIGFKDVPIGEMREIVFLNGKFLSADEAKISILDPVFLYGTGLFETMRFYNNTIVYFDQHLKRIRQSAKLTGIGISYPDSKLKQIIKETIRRNEFRDAYVRLTLWRTERGAGILVFVRGYKPYSKKKYMSGFNACISSFRQNEDSLLARIKTTSRILYQLSFQEAKTQGFDEAIILNNRGYIAEGTRSNIFFVSDNEIFTPALSCGCLDGITRRIIFDLAKKSKFNISQGNFTVQDLFQAEEAFLTNSLMGVMPLTNAGRKNIGNGKCAKTTRLFLKKYNYLLK